MSTNWCSTVADRYVTPSTRFFGIGLGMVAPTINAHAQDHIRQSYLPAMFRGELVSCQLFASLAPGPTSPRCRPCQRTTAAGDQRPEGVDQRVPSTPTSA